MSALIGAAALSLKQCCPTLSPFATCGDKRFECGDRKLLENLFLMMNKLQHFSNSDKSGDRENLVGHHCSKAKRKIYDSEDNNFL
jgi:hypothetical protein